MHAQAPTLPSVTVNDSPATRPADVTGFGDVPLKEVPISATVIGLDALQQSGARRLADLTQFDASVTDAYNSPGYWDFLSIRGFTLDNRFNYRREGLPISAETSIPLDNKERIEILKGTSGVQSGTSAPGGLVNYVVKRPTTRDLRTVRLETGSGGSVLAAMDLGGRLGTDLAFGYRLNVATETLRPITQALDGRRQLVALATDWRINKDSILEAELEWSHKRQASQAGFSLLGNALPAPSDPRINLNNQPWSQASVFDALTGTLRFEQAINSRWRWGAQLGTQQLNTDDRLAYPFGCSAENNYDRFCSDGTMDLYDFRSDNERRRQDVAALSLKGQLDTGSVRHDLAFGLQSAKVKNRFDLQAYNYAGTGNVQGTAVTPADPSLNDQNTNRDEKSVALSVHDAIRWSPALTTWVGLRHTRLNRSSIRTDGSRATDYSDSITTPWLAASYKLSPQLMAYASYGEGVESQIVPNRAAQYTNAGMALPALKSTQWELGFKGEQADWTWQAAWFQITRPMSNLDACSRLGTTPCVGQYDGDARHSGLEASAQWARGPWQLQGGITLLQAERRGSTLEAATNGKAPTNVPNHVLRASATWKVPGMQGMELQGQMSREGKRSVLPDGSITLPAWTRVDTALRYVTQTGAHKTTWSLHIDNLFDKRYWKEAPYQYGHVYLYPGAERTFRISMLTEF